MRGFTGISAVVFCTLLSTSVASVARGQTFIATGMPPGARDRINFTDAAAQLCAAGQYREAADLLRQATIADPEDKGVAWMLRLVTDKVNGTSGGGAEEGVPRAAVGRPAQAVPHITFMPADPPLASASPVSLSAKDRATRDILEENLKEIAANGQPLDKVFMFLRDNMGAHLLVNWGALHDVGIEKTTLVTVSLKDLPFRKALQTILSQVSGNSNNPLTYTVDDGSIIISTKADLNSSGNQVVKVFDIRDMLNMAPAPQVTEAGINMAEPAEFAKLRAQAVANLMDTIRTTVAPDTWKDSGGSVGTIRELNGQLIINQTVDNQIAIFNLLQQLRETRSIVINVESRVLLVSPSFLDDFRAAAAAKDQQIIWSDPKAASNPVRAPGTANARMPTTGTASASLPPAPKFSFPYTIVDTWTLSLMLTAVRGDKQMHTLTAPRVTLLNAGQAIFDCPLPLRYVSGVSSKPVPIEAEPYVPVYANTDTGLKMVVQAAVSADRRYVVFDAKTVARTLTGLEQPATPGPSGGQIEHPTLASTTGELMTSIPDGGTLLVNFGEVPGTGAPEQTAADALKNKRLMLLLVRPNIVIHRGDMEGDLFGVGYDRPTGFPSSTAPATSKP